MGNLSNAYAREESGDLSAAAKEFALVAFEYLIDSDYENCRQLREGLSMMLWSVCTDVRDANYRRARVHFRMVEPYYEEVARSSNEEAVRGLAMEWLGDAHLMLGDPEAVSHYEEALRIFEGLEFEDMMFWGAAPEYDSGFGAMEAFFESRGVSYPTDHSTDFQKRIQFKLNNTDIVGKLDRGSG